MTIKQLIEKYTADRDYYLTSKYNESCFWKSNFLNNRLCRQNRKCFLVKNTNIGKVTTLGEIVNERVRPNGKKKGSIGSERCEVFLTTKEELLKFLLIIEK